MPNVVFVSLLVSILVGNAIAADFAPLPQTQASHAQASHAQSDQATTNETPTGETPAGDPAAPSEQSASESESQPQSGETQSDRSPTDEYVQLFNGRDTTGWKVTEFGGQGDVYVEDKGLIIEFGSSLSGITYSGDTPLPKSNYELLIEAQRVDGIDFFCGVTFPVKDSHCSLIVGGWGGALVGLSSIDGLDASENATRTSRAFKRGQWYTIRLRVTDDKIRVWIDDERVIDQSIVNRKISIRPEVELSRPLGIATWDTKAKLRRVSIRRIKP